MTVRIHIPHEPRSFSGILGSLPGAAGKFLHARHEQKFLYDTKTHEEDMTQFFDDTTYQPGLGAHVAPASEKTP